MSRPGFFSDELDERLVYFYSREWSYQQIADELGATYNQVHARTVYLRKVLSIPVNHIHADHNRVLRDRRGVVVPVPDSDEPIAPSHPISVFSAPRLPGDPDRVPIDGTKDLLLDRLYDTHLLKEIVNEVEEPAARLTREQYRRICEQVPARMGR